MSHAEVHADAAELDIRQGNRVAILDAGAQYGMDIEQQAKRLGLGNHLQELSGNKS